MSDNWRKEGILKKTKLVLGHFLWWEFDHALVSPLWVNHDILRIYIWKLAILRTVILKIVIYNSSQMMIHSEMGAQVNTFKYFQWFKISGPEYRAQRHSLSVIYAWSGLTLGLHNGRLHPPPTHKYAIDFLVRWSPEDGSTIIYIEMVPSIWGIHIF